MSKWRLRNVSNRSFPFLKVDAIPVPRVKWYQVFTTTKMVPTTTTTSSNTESSSTPLVMAAAATPTEAELSRKRLVRMEKYVNPMHAARGKIMDNLQDYDLYSSL